METTYSPEQLIKLFTRYLKSVCGYPSNGRISKEKRLFCDECSTLSESFCQLYIQMEYIQLKLGNSVKQIYEKMTCSKGANKRLKTSHTPLEACEDQEEEYTTISNIGIQGRPLERCVTDVLDADMNAEQTEPLLPEELDFEAYGNDCIVVADNSHLIPVLLAYFAVLHIFMVHNPFVTPERYQNHQLEDINFAIKTESERNNALNSADDNEAGCSNHNPDTNARKPDKIPSDSEEEEDEEEQVVSSPRLSTGRVGKKDWIVEAIKDYRIVRKNRGRATVDYRTKWKDWPRWHNSWEPESNFKSKVFINKFWKHQEKIADQLNEPFEIETTQEGSSTNRKYFLN